MKLLILTAVIAAVASSPLTESPKWPWQVGKEYVYDVNSHTWTEFDQSESNGNSFKAQLTVRVNAPGHLVAKIDNAQYAQVQGQLKINDVPSDLKYQPIPNFDQPFEVFVDGGRILSINVPTALPAANENLLKGLISALQVDLSAYGHVNNFPNSYDKESFQGLFKKMEADVAGVCETLYSVSPASPEWSIELPNFVEADPFEIVKSKNYNTCQKRVTYESGVPENDENTIIKHTSEARVLAGKQGTIYKSQTLSSVFVNPLLFGKQKAEVYSYVGLVLTSVQDQSSAEWKKSEEVRTIDSLLLSLSNLRIDTYIPPDAQNIVDVQKLLQEITPLLQNPNDLPKSDFLSKFNVLVRRIMTLTSEQLSQVTNSIDVAESKNKWIVYRDAVAQAGTIDAFKEIKAWIVSKKIQAEEAAEVIGSLAGSLRFHTKEMKKEFFELAISPEVVGQEFLNTTALLAATKFLRLGEEDFYVVDKVIPYFSKELKQAIEDGNSSKAQVYIRVLGNLAHPDILKVFAPYLDGRVNVNKFLRTQIVISLKTLANEKNEYVRAALFSILRNTAEAYEVRVAAALNIFMAVPTSEMMQVMAHMTHDDPSTQVRAVLANSIIFASELKDPHFAELAETAKSVKSFIPKEKLGYRASTDSLIDEYSSADESGYFREMSFIGSKNSFLPKYQRVALRFRNNGWTEENWGTYSSSDIKYLFDSIIELFFAHKEINPDFKYSPQNIAELLNIKREALEPLEASFFIDMLNQQRLFTYKEQEFLAFILSLGRNIQQTAFGGVENQFVKVIYNKQVFVSFPLAMGLPFMYAYAEPIAFIINSKGQLKLATDTVASLHTDIQFTYARNMEGSVGFFDTIGKAYASSGITNKLQFYIPAKLKAVVNTGIITLKVELPKQDVNHVHLSVWPYTSVQKSNTLLSVLEDPATKLIERPNKVLSTELKLGQSAGVTYLLQGYSYSSDFKNPNALYDDTDLLTSIRYLLYQKDIALTQFDLKYLAEETKNKDITFSYGFDTLYNQKQSGEMGPAALIKNTEPNSEARREELAKRVASGIDSAKVQLVDFSAVFDGKQKVELVLTGALAYSYVDNKVQAALFIRGCEQINIALKMTKPKIAPLNFEEALKNEIKATYEIDIKYGNDKNIHIHTVGERSKQYTERLLQDNVAKQCLRETSKGNFYQKNCHKVIIKAHAPDYFKTTVSYEDVSPAFLKITYDIYEFLKNIYSWEEEENPFETIADGKLEITSQAFYYDKYIEVEIASKYGVLSLNIEGMAYYPYAMAIYAPTANWERARNWFTNYQYIPYCAVDDSKVRTFSGRSYDYSLTSSWHVVMLDEFSQIGERNNLVILARRPSANQEEVYISYKSEAGNYVELDIKPTSVDVKSNGKKVSEGALTIYATEDTPSWSNPPILEYYTIAEGVLVFSINNGAIRFIYDSQRLVIFTDDYRSVTRGICGQSSTEIRDDYLTPWGLVNLPELYGASFSLVDDLSDPKTVELKKEAKLKAYQPVTKYTNILRSDAEWTQAKNKSVKGQ